MSDTTLLELDLHDGELDLSPWACRGIKLDVSPIDGGGSIERDINGNMIDLTNTAFRKLKATISCSDQESPGFVNLSSDGDSVWPGSVFTVTFLEHGPAAEPIELDMMVMAPGWKINRDETEAVTEWSLDLEQV